MEITIHNTAELPVADYREFNDLQGNLKQFDVTNEAKLLKEMQTDGFRFPFFVWQDKKGKYWTIDGNGRKKIMVTNDIKNADGTYDFPILKVYATNKKDAAKNILRVSSEYHKKTKEGFDFFISDHGIDSEWVDDFTAFGDSFNYEKVVVGDEPDYDDLIGENKDKPPTMKITFEAPEQLQKAEIDIQELIDRKYSGAYFSVSCGEL